MTEARVGEIREVNVKQRAERAAVERLVTLKGSSILREEHPGYTKLPEQNLVPGVRREDFWDDLNAGDGRELKDSARGSAKFCAAYSSSALVVNTFGPFRHAPELLTLAGRQGFQHARFEKKCHTGLLGNPPNLDFFVEGPGAVIGVESK